MQLRKNKCVLVRNLNEELSISLDHTFVSCSISDFRVSNSSSYY
jgi:hypothetical protein